MREFRVVGLFEAGIQDHDATLAFASLDTLLSTSVLRAAAASACRSQVEMPWRRLLWPLQRRVRSGRWSGRRARPRLDAGSRELLPRHPHREDHDGADPAAGRGRRCIQHRGDAGDGGDRQAHRHRHPADAGRGTGSCGRGVRHAGPGRRLGGRLRGRRARRAAGTATWIPSWGC